MSRFVSLSVADIKKETSDAVSVAFNIPTTHKEEFKFIQGQYITLKLHVNGEEIRRSYSICSGVGEGELRVAIKKVNGGKGSNYINDVLKVGEALEVMPPMGNFYTPLNASNKKNYVLFAGGSGITPMLSIIKTVLIQEPQSTITLFYGNRDTNSIIFKAELDKLVSQHAGKLNVYHILENPEPNTVELYTGLMNPTKNMALIENHVGLNLDNEFFVCGPTPMMDAVKGVLEKVVADKKRIHIEYFTAPVESAEAKATKGAVSETSVASDVTVILDGDELNIKVKANQSILEAVLNAGYDAPYACQGGSCCTCRALMTDGKARMTVNYALLDDEVQQGYILTCQAVPLTPTMVVDYDRGK